MIDPSVKSNRLIWLALILLTTLAVYARSINYGTVNWDEPLTGTMLYQERPGLEGVLEIVKPRLSATYQPVREVALAMLAPYGLERNWAPYHAVSLLFYLGTILFLYLLAAILIRRMSPEADEGAIAAAALGAAALFALHPTHAESIAWVSGQKDALVAFFYLGSLFFYIRHEYPSLSDYLLCLLMFALALGSKPSAVSLPLVMVAYDLTVRGTSGRIRALKKLWPGYLPFFLPAAAMVVFFLYSSTRLGAMLPELAGSLGRLVKAAATTGFSAAKLLLPVNLCLRYPAFGLEWGNPAIYLYTLSGLLIVGWTGYAIYRRKKTAFLLCWFLLSLAPNSNLVRIAIERADRYFYLPSAAFAVLAAWVVLELYRGKLIPGTGRIKWAALAIIVLMGVMSWNQAGYWRNGLSAWKRTFQLYPDFALARLGVASSYLRTGDFDEALRYYRPMLEGNSPNTEAIKGAVYISQRRNDRDMALELARLGHKLDPEEEQFMETLVGEYFADGDTTAAAEIIEDWVESNPNSGTALLSLGKLYELRGDTENAERTLRGLINMYPEYSPAYNALAQLKQDDGDLAAAERIYLDGLATGRRTAETRQKLAALYEKMGKPGKALEIYSRYASHELSLAGLEFMGAHFFARDRYDSSLVYFQQMATRDPDMPRAYSNSAVVMEKLSRPREADSLYALAVNLDSGYVDAWFNWGHLARAGGDYDAAVERFQHADSLAGGRDGAVTEALIRALVARGDTAEAKGVYERARALSGQSGVGGPK